MKGIGPLIVLAIVGAISLYSLILAVVIGRTEINVRALVEKEILSAINRMEFTKREIPIAIKYSFYQASFDLANRGGYETFETSYNCIPYWKVFSQNNIPYFETNFKSVFLKIFSKYTSDLSDYTLSFPKFQVNVDKVSGKLDVFSSDNIVIQNPNFYTLKENALFTENIDTRIFVMFDIGNQFVEKMSQEISSSSSYEEALKKVVAMQDDFNSKYSGEYTIIAQPENNLASDANNFAFRTLVLITDNSDNKYPIFDFSQSKNVYANFKLNFYVLDGKDSSIQPITNVCEEIKY
jgi:hypothetical protein